VVEITRPSPQSLRPNWWAIACLYLVVASWLALALRIMLDEILSVDSALDWAYVTMMLGGIVAGAAGLVAIRTRGDAWLAVSAFFASLLLPAGYALMYLLVAILFGGYGDGGGFD
jgi:hypothetical protein